MSRMSEGMRAGPALEQLRELISILRELGNAGPRDNSFKQWRQVTLTLLQRVWAGDPARAVRFRRIPFSAPSSRADAKTIRESYVHGVNEAIAYLEGLAHELESDAGQSGMKLVRPPEATAPPSEDGGVREVPATDVTATPPPAARRSAPARARSAEDTPPPPPSPHGARGNEAPPVQDSGKVVTRSRQRLKDMLGFGDEGTASPIPAKPAAPMPPAAPPPPTQPAASSPAPLMPEIPTPARAAREEPASPPLRLVPTPTPSAPDPDLDDQEYALDFDLAEAGGSDADPEPATLWELLERESMPRAAAATPAAREMFSMATMVEQLGVPPQRRVIVRAALIDLGHQMDAPPVQWAAIRQALAFIMDYPQIARRVLPMLLPYLDAAA